MAADEIQHFSYAADTDPKLRRMLIRAIETMSGQPYLKSLYEEHTRQPLAGESFWAAAIRMLELKLVWNKEALAHLPRQGPLAIVANHPFGVLDGVVISYIVSELRSDFVVLTNSVLYQAKELRPHLLPVDFAETKEALETNLKSRAAAKAHLTKGGCLVIFPAGGASTAPRPWSRFAVDAEWKTLTARLISAAKAPVAPIYFAGQNSRLFQIASHISMTLRLSLFFREVYDKIGSEIHVRVGKPIPYSELEGLDRKAFMEHLRARTYELGMGMPKGRVKGRRPMRARHTP
jgi:putative hemolysin